MHWQFWGFLHHMDVERRHYATDSVGAHLGIDDARLRALRDRLGHVPLLGRCGCEGRSHSSEG